MKYTVGYNLKPLILRQKDPDHIFSAVKKFVAFKIDLIKRRNAKLLPNFLNATALTKCLLTSTDYIIILRHGSFSAHTNAK